MKISFPCLAAATLALAACAPAIEPLRVRAADLSKMPERAPDQPIIVEVAEGDVIPIDLAFEGELIELTPRSPALSFRAKRRFFVKIDKSGLTVSTDGVHFGERPKQPGSFRLGLAVKREGAKVEIGVKMPVHGGS